VLGIRRKNGLGPRELWPVPLALGAILIIAQAASRMELLLTSALLGVGALVLVARRRFFRGG
jgi:hypothetical protein